MQVVKYESLLLLSLLWSPFKVHAWVGPASNSGKILDQNIHDHESTTMNHCPSPERVSRRSCFVSTVTSVSLGVWSSASNSGLSPMVKPSWALDPQQAATEYDIYAKNYDQLDGGKASSMLGIDEARARLVGQAVGDVLEIGVGTGLNLEYYNLRNIKSLTFVDISDGMLQQAKNRIPQLIANGNNDAWKSIPVQFMTADATSQLVSLFGEDAFDTVLDSFSLCVMGTLGANQCLDQMSRVVKKKDQNGQLLLLENTRSSNPLLGLYQDSTADAAASMGGKGCVYNQDVGAMISKTAGLTIQREDLYAAGLFRSFYVSRQ